MEYVLYHATWCPFCIAFLEEWREIMPGGKEVIMDDQNDPLWVEKNLDFVPTVVGYENDVEKRRLMATAGVGITREMFEGWMDQ